MRAPAFASAWVIAQEIDRLLATPTTSACFPESSGMEEEHLESKIWNLKTSGNAFSDPSAGHADASASACRAPAGGHPGAPVVQTARDCSPRDRHPLRTGRAASSGIGRGSCSLDGW